MGTPKFIQTGSGPMEQTPRSTFQPFTVHAYYGENEFRDSNAKAALRSKNFDSSR